MMNIDKKIEELRQRKEYFKRGGRPDAIEKQRAKGKLIAREVVELLFDPGSFFEYDLLVTSPCKDFGLDKVETPGDGCITGCGKINGRQVFAYIQDFTIAGGSIGVEHGKKLIKTTENALKMRVPLIMLTDSGGIRPQEQQANLETYGWIFYQNTLLSGVVPQISLVTGPVAGGPCYSPAITDFIIMVKGTSQMFIGGPAVTKELTGEDVTEEQLGGAEMHGSVSGVTDLVASSGVDCLDKAKELLSFLPSNNQQQPPIVSTGDDPNRTDETLKDILPDSPTAPYDMHKIITRLVDNGYFFELKPNFAKNLITGFARLAGQTVGILASQPLVLGGALDIDAADKGTRFTRFCDAFNIPLVYIVDTPGYLVGTKMERGGIIRHGAKFIYATSEVTVPKVRLVIRRAYAGARLVMGCKFTGADLAFAWPTAEFATFGVDAGMAIILRSTAMKEELAKAENPDKLKQEMMREYKEKYLDLYKVAPGRHAEDIIDPKESRPVLIQALEYLKNKRVERPWRKHGNIPV